MRQDAGAIAGCEAFLLGGDDIPVFLCAFGHRAEFSARVLPLVHLLLSRLSLPFFPFLFSLQPFSLLSFSSRRFVSFSSIFLLFLVFCFPLLLSPFSFSLLFFLLLFFLFIFSFFFFF